MEQPKVEKAASAENKKAREYAKQIFDSLPVEQRTEQMMRILGPVFNDGFFKERLPGVVPESFQAELEKVADSKNADEYSTAVMSILQPFFALSNTHPKEFVEMRRRVFLAGPDNKWTPVNEVLTYGIDDGELHIHLPPLENMSDPDKVLQLLEDGLRALFPVLEQHKEVLQITATSWMVAKKLVARVLTERFGFTIVGEISEEEKRNHFRGETRPVHLAVISREDFLKRFGPQGNK